MNLFSLFSIFILLNVSNCFAENCGWYDADWFHNRIPYHRCAYSQWLDKSEVRSGATWYHCCTGEYKHWVRDGLFRIAMEKGGPIGDRKCLLYVLCEVGCTDMVTYGSRDTNLQKKEGDSKELTEDIDAWYKGQKFAGAKSENVCTSNCTKSYPDCPKSNNWRTFYKLGHKVGMGIFDGVTVFMNQFSNQETQRKIGEKVFEYVTDFYEVSAKVIEFGISETENVKKFIVEKIDILLPKLKALEKTIHDEAAKEDNGKIKQWLVDQAETQVKDMESRLISFEKKFKDKS